MKSKKIIGALVLTLTMSLGAIAYADTTNEKQQTDKKVENRLGFNRNFGKRGYDIMRDALASKLGISTEEIDTMREEGKNFYDIAKEKGLTDEDIKTIMKDERIKLVDEALSSGKITQEEADQIKAKINENVDNCAQGKGMGGNKQGKGFGGGNGKGNPNGRGMRGSCTP